MNYLDLFGVEKISGAKGSYDSKVKNKSVKYGRNSIANYKQYVKDYGAFKPESLNLSDSKGLTEQEFDDKIKKANNTLDGKVNLKYNVQYMPDENINKMALLGAAYEEIGKKTSVSGEEITKKLQSSFGNTVDSGFLDINKDNNIDIGEYSISILMADMLSKNPNALDLKNINGHFTNNGITSTLKYARSQNKEAAAQDAKAIYEALKIAEAQKSFIQEENNLIE